MLIGELASRLGIGAKTVRYYERIGLLRPPSRNESGYREYCEDDVERLEFIQGAKVLGLNLDQIREVLEAWDRGEHPCSRVSQFIESKLADLDEQIRTLESYRNRLRAYRDEVAAHPEEPEVPCRHVSGVLQGDWKGAKDPPPVALERGRCHGSSDDD